jgi:hypothetical protein
VHGGGWRFEGGQGEKRKGKEKNGHNMLCPYEELARGCSLKREARDDIPRRRSK